MKNNIKEIGVAWRELSAEEKEYWKEKADEEKSRFKKSHPDYMHKRRVGGAGGAGGAGALSPDRVAASRHGGRAPALPAQPAR